MENEIVVKENKPLTAAEIRENVNLIQDVMSEVMQKDQHYGVIPGCKKPSLFKAGAEKLSLTFRLRPIMDNDKDICWLIASILKEEDLCVDIAHDVKSALTKISRHRYQIMVLDYKLSGMSGLTVLEKTHQIKPPIVTIMISAFGNESVKAKAKEFGAYAFLDKPFNIDGLKRSVKRALIEQKRRCVNEANRNSKHSCSTSSEHFGSTGFGSTGASSDSSTNSSKDRHSVHIGAS